MSGNAPPAAETAASVREEAAEHRSRAAELRAEAETLVTNARAQAQRLVADAETRARDLERQAVEADRAAQPLIERAQYLAHAEQLRAQIADAEQTVLQLAGEAETLTEQTAGLDARLEELGEQRETVGMDLAAATERGDIDQVVEHRNRHAGLDQIIAAVQGQRQTARDRLQAVGTPDGSGELGRAASGWQRLVAELRTIENRLDPTRPEALLDEIREGLKMQVALHQEQAGRAPARTTMFAGSHR